MLDSQIQFNNRKRETPKQSRPVKNASESELMELRRQSMAMTAKLNRLLGLDLCEKCGKK